MEAVTGKWGNSPAMRLPSSALNDAGYVLGQKAELIVSRGRIVIQHSDNVTYNLETLLTGITKDKSHEEASFSNPLGPETF